MTVLRVEEGRLAELLAAEEVRRWSEGCWTAPLLRVRQVADVAEDAHAGPAATLVTPAHGSPWSTVRTARRSMRIHRLLALVVISVTGALLTVSCVQTPATPTTDQGSAAPPADEPVGEAEQEVVKVVDCKGRGLNNVDCTSAAPLD